ncbi:MAG: hypothetical protein KAT65_02555 [Methanophagales archaeon]|nr:hypothetical protein [Methanophagales archaeon]
MTDNDKLKCKEWIEAGIDPSFLNYHVFFKEGVPICENCPFKKECPVHTKDYEEKIEEIEILTGKIVYLRCPVLLTDEKMLTETFKKEK